MKKKIILLLIFISLAFLGSSSVEAYTISGDNTAGRNEWSDNSGVLSSPTTWPGPYLKAIRIRIFRDDTAIKSAYFTLADNKNGCYYLNSNLQLCETSSYNYPNVNSTSGVTCKNSTVKLSCLASSGFSKLWDVDYFNGVPLKTFLEESNYSKLKEVLATMGYNDTNFNNKDIVIVEPATLVKCNNEYYFGTSTALMKKNVSFRGASGNVCAGGDNTFTNEYGTFTGVTFQPVFESMSKAFNNNGDTNGGGYGVNKFTGYGYFKYNITGLYEDPKGNLTIIKKDSATGKTISGAGFRVHSGSGCTGSIVKNGLNTNSSGQASVTGLTAGNYSVYEILVPNGYATPSNRCTNVTVKAGQTTATTVTINNTPLGNLTIIKENTNGGTINGVGFTLYNGSGCTGSVAKREQKTSSGKTTFSDLVPGNYSVYESTIPDGFVTPSNRCTNVYVGAGTTIKQTIYNTPKGGLRIIKKNSTNDLLAQLSSKTQIKFRLYTNSSCSGTAIKDFKAGETVSNLNPGTYYLKEYQTKNGYHLPQQGEKWFCEPITITAGATKEIIIENKTECEYQFNANMTMKQRIDLYNLIKTKYSQEFNALLDLSNKTAETACQNIPITTTYTTGCLSAKTTSTDSAKFSTNNVSMYTEKYGKYTFCLTTYELANDIGKNTFTGIKSGQAIMKTDDKIATGTLKRVCYNYGDTSIIDSNYTNFSYANYIKTDASIDGEKLIKSETSSGTTNNQTIKVEYTLPYMYASNKDGRVSYGKCPTGEYCKSLGKGIISQFNLEPTVKRDTNGKLIRLKPAINLGFNIQLNSANNVITSWKLQSQNDCTYDIENELIDYNSEIDLEFRSVNTNSNVSFLNKDGSEERNFIGSNWSLEEDRKKVLDVNNNSYDRTGAGAKYKITLTPSIIEDIRKDNKNKEYDDYNFTCKKEGTICISNYLTCLQNEGTLKINNSTKRSNFLSKEIVCK